MFCVVTVISPNFDVMSIIFPNFGQGPFPKIAGKSPVLVCDSAVNVAFPGYDPFLFACLGSFV